MAWKRIAKVGGRGYTVSVWRHPELHNLRLRHGSEWRATDTAELAEAIPEAKEWAADLLAGRRASRGAGLTLEQLFRLYRSLAGVNKSATQRKEDARRIDLWLHFLGPQFDPMALTGARLRAFERQRRAGDIRVPGRKLRAVRAKSVREDLSFLRTVLRWASGMEGGHILPGNPMEGYRLPVEINPHRPRAYMEDFEAIQKVAPQVDPLLGPFLALVESLGWRVSAIAAIEPADFDPTRTRTRPHGRLLKREESDKVGVQRWTVLPAAARSALEEAIRLTGKAGRQPLFEKPRRPGRPWDKDRARALLRKAYELTEVPRERWVGFHAYRRKWVDERKHLPRADVAAQGAWLSQRTLEIYESPDEETLLAVAEEPRKLRMGEKT